MMIKLVSLNNEIHIKLNYVKRNLFYLNKTPEDLTNSKNFWDLYQASIKIKSHKSSNKSPDSIMSNNELVTDTFEITNTYNNHSSFTPDSSISNVESCKFILISFKNMLKSDIESSKNEYFKFLKITKEEVNDLLKKLDLLSSPGISGLLVSILKEARLYLADNVKIMLIMIRRKSCLILKQH
jgi:hypothetical protein